MPSGEAELRTKGASQANGVARGACWNTLVEGGGMSAERPGDSQELRVTLHRRRNEGSGSGQRGELGRAGPNKG